MMIDIILVHTGSQFPAYLNDCIEQLKKYNNFNIHLIISDDVKSGLIHNDIIVVRAEDCFDSDYNSYVIQNYDPSFRDGFWKRTSSRFILIGSYAKKINLSSFIHIENDVLVFSNFEKLKDILDRSRYEMGVVIDSENRCIPSVMYFKNSQVAEDLSKFIIKNNTNNDMTNIFYFFFLNRQRVTNLPILPKDISFELVSKTGIKCSGQIDYSNLYDTFDSIFDGAAIGQYLGGIDTRNNPANTVGFINETTIFDVSRFSFVWENNEPYAYLNGIKIKVNNLHIHSKNLRKFLFE